MKRWMLPLVAPLALLVTVATAAKETRVTDSSRALSVAVPTGWKSDKSGLLGSKLILFGPEHEGFRVNINLMTEKVGSMSLSDYARVSEENAGKIITGYELLSKGSTKMDGVDARFMVYRGSIGTPPRQLEFKGVFSIRGKIAYILTYTAPKDVFDQHQKAFDTVVKSVKWQQHKH